jgi:hypothetical protein
VNKKIRTIYYPQVLLHLFLAFVLFELPGPLLRAQEIRILVLNGKNGKPITDECLNVSIGLWHGGDLIAPANSEGTVVLHLRNNEATADSASHRACNGTAVVGPKTFPTSADSISIASDMYFACQEYGRVVPGQPVTSDLPGQMMPSYSIKAILESGITGSNTCGKFREKAKPGELIFFVRPLTWSERMRR